MSTDIESLRASLKALPGTHEQKARDLGVQVTWLSKFLRGKIQEPRLSRVEQISRYITEREVPTREAA